MIRYLTRLLSILAIIAATAAGYEPNMLDMAVPTGLKPGQMEVRIQHRFLGRADKDPLGTLLGTDQGANPAMALRAPVWRSFELRAGYTRNQKEYSIGASYGAAIAAVHARAQLSFEFFSYQKLGMDKRRQNGFYLLSLQSGPVLGRARLGLNAGYDAYNLQAGIGIGALVGIAGPMSIIGEYYPTMGRTDSSTYLGPVNSMALGLRLDTYGHQFTILVGNNTEVGARRMMLGSPANRPYLGFVIQRRIEFN